MYLFNPETFKAGLSATDPTTSFQPLDRSAGFFAVVDLEGEYAYRGDIFLSAASAAVAESERITADHKLFGTAPSDWPRQVRWEVYKRLLRSLKSDDEQTSRCLAYVVREIAGSPYYALGLTQKGRDQYLRTYPETTRLAMQSRIERAIAANQAALRDAAHGQITRTSRHMWAMDAAVRTNQQELAQLSVFQKLLWTGEAFDLA